MKRFFLWTSFGLIGLVLIALAFLPTFLSTSFGKENAIKWINRSIPGKIEAKEIHLSWFGKQSVDHFSLKSKEGTEIASFKHFETNSSLIYILFGGRKLDGVVLQSPYISIEQKGETSNLDEALGKKKKTFKKDEKLLFALSAKKALIENGMVVFSSENIKPIVVTDLYLKKERKPNTLDITAKTKQDRIEGNVILWAECNKNLKIKADIKNFPVALFDQLMGSSLFTEAIGNTLNASLDMHREKNSVFVDADLESSHLKALLKGETFNRKLHLSPESQLKITLTPGFFNQIIEGSQKQAWSLASKTDLTFKIQNGIFPLTFDKKNFKEIVLQAHANLERAEIHHQTLGSYSLNHFDVSLISANNLEISYKGEIRGKESTQLEGIFSITPDRKILFETKTKGFPVSLVDLFSPELAERLDLVFGKNIDLEANGTFVEQNLDSQFSIASTCVQLQGKLGGKFPDYIFNTSGKINIQGEKAKLIGASAALSMEGKLDWSQKSPTIPLITGKLSNEQIETEFKGKLGEKGEPFRYEQINLGITGNIKKILTLENYPIQEGMFSLNIDGAKNRITGKASGSFSGEASSLRFEMKEFIKEKRLNLENSKTNFEFRLVQLPVILFNAFLPEKVTLSSLIGEFADLNGIGKLIWGKDPYASVEMEAKASGFASTFSFDVNKALKISLNKPSRIHWEMTPERYSNLLSSFHLDPNYRSEYHLVKTAPIDLKLSKLECPPLGANQLGNNLCNSGLDAEAFIGSLVFKRNDTDEAFVVQDITAALKAEHIGHTLNVDLAGNLASVLENKTSAFALKGQIINLCSGSVGKFDHEKMTFKGELNLDLLPVKQLTEIVPMDLVTRKKVQAILGEIINARISGEISHLTGPLTIDIKSSNFKATLPLQLTPNAIYLRDYVSAELTLTEEISDTFIKDINPIIFSGAFSDHPVKIFIDPQGFVLPIRPYFLEGVKIEKAVIDIGKITVRNGGQIQKLMDFVKATDITPDGLMDAWFTPIYVSLQNGTLSYQRFDMLMANFVHIALWGNINLINDNVNMVLGIAPSTLQLRFDIGMAKQELFQVKMKGTTEKLDLDWSSAKTRIGVLLARKKGGPYGFIIGGIIEQFLKEEYSPPPTTTPFPWER